jgi:GNAT superfamily N-acetyltransferase
VAIEAESRRGVAVARYAGYAGEPGRSEFAITVADDWQGRGIGSAFSRRLLFARVKRVSRCSRRPPWPTTAPHWACSAVAYSEAA